MEERKPLNPFVYISETDIRFYLLVVIGILVPSLWAWIIGLVFSSVMAELQVTLLLRVLILVPIVLFVPSLIYWRYIRFPTKIVEESRLKELDEKKFPEVKAYLQQLEAVFPSTLRKPVLMYRPLDPSGSAFTFGTKTRTFLGIPGGLLVKFLKNIQGFRSIILHEFGHIFNRDVEKAYLAESTWRSILFLLLIPVTFSLVIGIYLEVSRFYYGIQAGLGTAYLVQSSVLGKSLALYGGIILYFLIFMGILYLLRNQIIRLREFYADARVLEWEGSPDELVKTLEENEGKPSSRFEILAKFHPNISERIQVLKDNRELFTPSLWVGFSVGFFFGIIEFTGAMFLRFLFLTPQEWEFMKMADYQPAAETFIVPRAIISVVLFTFLMLAISSSFHRSTLWSFFKDGKYSPSTGTLLAVLQFSLAFSLGWLTDTLIFYPSIITLYEGNILLGDLLDIGITWILNAFYFSLSVMYLIIFASMSIQRSFSRKEAEKSFFYITGTASFLYILNRFLFIETLHNKFLVVVSFFIFSIVTYAVIKCTDRNLQCPHCGNKLAVLPEITLNCRKCGKNLFPWAFYTSPSRPVN